MRNPPTTRPRTPAQREASRRNGARSRGPRTAQGKYRASRNALKHGLYARRHRLFAQAREDHGRRAELLATFEDHLPVRSAAQQLRLEMLTDQILRLQQLGEIEQALLCADPQADLDGPATAALRQTTLSDQDLDYHLDLEWAARRLAALEGNLASQPGGWLCESDARRLFGLLYPQHLDSARMRRWIAAVDIGDPAEPDLPITPRHLNTWQDRFDRLWNDAAQQEQQRVDDRAGLRLRQTQCLGALERLGRMQRQSAQAIERLLDQLADDEKTTALADVTMDMIGQSRG
jgi:hypothetical protein